MSTALKLSVIALIAAIFCPACGHSDAADDSKVAVKSAEASGSGESALREVEGKPPATLEEAMALAKAEGKKLTLRIGFSHPVTMEMPDGIEIVTPEPTKITVKGRDKQLVGEIAARIRRIRPPEPYKGKGIRYVGEHVRRKAGKTFVAVG